MLFVTKQVIKNKGSLYGHTNYNNLVKPFLFSRHYTFIDLIRRLKGSSQSIKYLWKELMYTNFESITSFGSPVLFVEGRYDNHVSSKLTIKYFNTIETKKKFEWFENSCHFPQWSESERFNQLICDLADDSN